MTQSLTFCCAHELKKFRINPYYPEHYPEFEGKMIDEVMPFMFGAIVIRGKNNIFDGLLRKCLKLPVRYHRWFGDQVALAKAVAAGTVNYSVLNPHIYLNIVSSVPMEHHVRQLIDQGVQMLTFKGPTLEKMKSLLSAYQTLKTIHMDGRE